MSIYSDHAANVNQIQARIAAIEADRIRRKGDLVGGTLSALGQLPLQILQQRDREKQQARLDARQQQQDQLGQLEIQDKLGDRTTKLALTKALQQAKTLLEQADAFEQFGNLDQAQKIRERGLNAGAQLLESSTAATWKDVLPAIRKNVPPALANNLPDEYPDTPDPGWKVATIQEWTQGPKEYIAAHTPNPADLVPIAGPDGKPVYGKKQAGAAVYEKPPAVSQDLVPTVGPDGKPVYGPKVAGASVYERPRAPVAAIGGADDVKLAVQAMKDGTVPPMLPGRASKEYTAMMAEANRQGFDLAGAATDWLATQKHIATLNGAQQLRLNQGVNALPELLDSVEALADKWKGGKFPILNKVTLALAENGAFGQDAASIAKQLKTQIADVTADLGNVYMGGNSPTDNALKLAGTALSADWSEKVLRDMIALARKNVQIRRNSINNTGVAGASPDNPYAPASPAQSAPVTPPPGARIRTYDPATGTLR